MSEPLNPIIIERINKTVASNLKNRPLLKIKIILRLAELISYLPLSVLRLLGLGMGIISASLNTRAIKVSRINLRLAHPTMSEEEVEQISRLRMRQLGKLSLETPKMWRKGSQWLDSKIVDIEGIEYLNDALSDNKGTIAIAPHFGNWEVVGQWLSQKAPMTSLYKPPKDPLIEKWVKDSRETSGATLVPTNVRGVAAVMKALKRGELTGILPDQQPPLDSGAFSPYFGIPALTMTLIHNLIQRTDCRAIVCLAELVPGGWKLIFRPVSVDLYSTDQDIHLAALNREIESVAMLAPDQYQWEYKRFREQPNGDSNFYP